MKTTVETSRTSTNYTTSKTRLSLATVGIGKEPETQVTGGSSTNLQSRFELSEPASDTLRFRDLSADERKEAKDTLKELSHQARVWVRDSNQSLHRADPAEIKERLDAGQPIEVVTRLGREVREDYGSRSSSDTKTRGFFTGSHDYNSQASSASRRENVVYTSSPLTSWDSLEFVDTDGLGVPGTPTLPASGGSVTVSSSFESDWSHHTEERWGFFTEKAQVSDNSSHTRIRNSAE